MSKVEINITPTNVGKIGTIIDMPVVNSGLKVGTEVSIETLISAKEGIEVPFEVETISGK